MQAELNWAGRPMLFFSLDFFFSLGAAAAALARFRVLLLFVFPEAEGMAHVRRSLFVFSRGNPHGADSESLYFLVCLSRLPSCPSVTTAENIIRRGVPSWQRGESLDNLRQ